MSRDTQLTTGAHVLQTEILERGYSEFRHGIPDEQVHHLVERYADFTLGYPDPLPETMDAMLPVSSTAIDKNLDELDRSQDTQQEWHKYRTNTEGIGKPDGYTNRSFQERALMQARGIVIPPEDPKEFFHYTPRHYGAMARNHQDYGWSAIPSELTELEKAFRPIHLKASELIIRVAALIEETHPEIRQYFNPPSLHTSPVRLLFYHPSNKDCLGAGHYDKSSLTVQIAESHEGLRIAPNDQQELKPVVRGSDMAVVFPSHRLRQKFGADTPFQPGWHDITKTDRLNEGRTIPAKAVEVCARWALIFFANGNGFVNPDKSLMHTR